ncbi:MAG: hypothetical protein ABEH43_02820, partial [Flavobacteriales bacterium]
KTFDNMEKTKQLELPEPPKDISATNIIKRMVDGLDFRLYWSLYDLNDNFLEFRAAKGSMNVKELLVHVHGLCKRICSTFGGEYKGRPEPESIEKYREECHQLLASASASLEKMEDSTLQEKATYNKRTNSYLPFWYIINGPIADALTHTGQINSWRRIAGYSPVKVDVFFGKMLD